MHPKQRGIISEQAIIAELLKLGIPVSVPVGDNLPYDIIIDINGILKKVQCRTGRIRNGVVQFNACSQRINTKGSYRTYYNGKIDCFIVYEPVNNMFYIYRYLKDSPHTIISLRIENTKNNQELTVKFAKDYILNSKNVSALLNNVEPVKFGEPLTGYADGNAEPSLMQSA